ALEVVEQALDAVATSVQAAVESSTAVFARRVAADDGLHAAIANLVDQRVGVVAGVADERSAASRVSTDSTEPRSD
ncbi:MAG: hypothetical protein JWN44_2346, partial [Myxococcales bacterium]|nr:hypothetical protein [Myxococcales bacterium]